MNQQHRTGFLRALGVLGLLLLAVPSFAGLQHPAVERGFRPEKAFQVGDLDNVNLFNGNLAITLPLGQSFSVGGGFTYQLTLVYNSKAWDWEFDCTAPGGRCQHVPRPAVEGNAGLGWTLTLGELVGPEVFPRNPARQWMYVSADGGEHLFYDTLHPNDANDPAVSFTRDGSYLRMKVLAGGVREVEHPDGTIHRFNAQGRLTSIRDRLANQLTISYPTANRWTLTDGFRTHYVDFTPMNVDGVVRRLVTEVNLAAFGGTRARYRLQYASVNGVPGIDVERPCPYNPKAIDPNPIGAEARVQLLDRVILPDGATVGASSRFHMAGYQLTRAKACQASGALTKLRLPTLGSIAWGYGAYFFPTGTSEPPGGGPGNVTPGDYLRRTSGVTSRTLLDADDNVTGAWSYFHKITHEGGTDEPVEITNTVVDPENVKTIHYFSAYPGGGTSVPGASIHNYGLPFTVKAGDGAGRYLSKQVFARGSSTSVLRTTYVRYEHDAGGQTVPGEHGEHLNLNRRLASQRIVYHDDGSRYTDTNHTDWDGLGHYRQVSMSASGNWPGRQVRTERTNYNPGGMPATHAPWILGTYNETWQQEHGLYASQGHCFEANTGFLLRTRARSSHDLSNSNNDVVTVNTRDGRGNVVLASHHGGDNQAIATSNNLCGLNLPASAEYAIKHWYTAGTLRRSVYQTATGTNMAFKSLDLTIDPSTGLASESRDVARLVTTYTYDGLGRTTLVQPSAGHGACTQYTYRRAINATDLADVRIRRRANNGCVAGAVLHERQVHFDERGRVWQEKNQLPNGTYATRETRYNALGWTTQVSEQELTPTHWTKFLNFDEFGRARTVRPPDGATHDVTFTYTGVREVGRTVKIQQEAGLLPATTTERYDNHRRLWQVSEPEGGVTATYTYDRGNRLARASVVGVVGGANVTQVRQWLYDGRGFLAAEWMPERGLAHITGGWRAFAGIDSRGHATIVDSDGDGQNDLVYTYDRAERLTHIHESPATGGRELERFIFATGNSGADQRRGRLWQAIRHNYRDIPWTPQVDVIDAKVTETYQYAGKDGRPSRRDTDIAAVGYSFNQTWFYDELGNVTGLGYPRCEHATCTGGTPGPARTQAQTFTRGWLTGVAGFADSIGYHPSGMVAQVIHRNGPGVTTRETIVADPWGMARPRRFDYQARNINGTSLLWNSSTYTYDGAGNIVDASGTYRYDALSRVVRHTFGGPNEQVYDYDRFGNLFQVETTTPSTGTQTYSLAMNSQKNRLAAGPIIAYDGRGNLLQGGPDSFVWDPLDQLATRNFPEESYVYTADGERVYTIVRKPNAPLEERLTLRGLDNKVLRTWEVKNGNQPANWRWAKDYVYRSGTLLATENGLLSSTDPNRIEQLFVDHLGSNRASTNRHGHISAGHRYWAFGQEPPDFHRFAAETMRFTGHERDHRGDQDTRNDLDYMHARYYSPHLARFLSIDPAGNSAQPANPQSWNRYAYALNNPVKLVDPDGEIAETAWDVVNVGVGIKSLVRNIREGNVGGALLDGVGVVVDTAAAVVPGVPGGAGVGIKALRATDTAFSAGKAFGRGAKSLADDFLSQASSGAVKVLNSQIEHAAQRATQRAGFASVGQARSALRAFSSKIAKGGLPAGAIKDPSKADRIIVPGFGDGGAVVFQVTKNGKLRLKTVLKYIPDV